MGLAPVIVLASLAILTLASPAEPPQPQNPRTGPFWASVVYSFLISENPAKVPRFCGFTVTAAGGLPAYQTDFAVLKCPGVPEYTINGGWDERAFVTLTVINDQRSLLSFFAFTDADLWAGVEATPQTSKVFIHPMPVKRELKQEQEKIE
ncbi:small secreted protein [Colletotrichum higginsianum]|nr:small secreted protein [Colletotrichum higginsianum]